MGPKGLFLAFNQKDGLYTWELKNITVNNATTFSHNVYFYNRSQTAAKNNTALASLFKPISSLKFKLTTVD